MTIIQYDQSVLKMEKPKHDWNAHKILSIVGTRGNN